MIREKKELEKRGKFNKNVAWYIVGVEGKNKFGTIQIINILYCRC